MEGWILGMLLGAVLGAAAMVLMFSVVRPKDKDEEK